MSSKNKGKRLIILVAALAVLAGLYFIISPKLAPEPSNAANFSVFDIGDAEVSSITWRYAGEENTFELKDDAYVWTEAGPDDNIDWTNVKYMVAAFRFLSSKKAIDLAAGADLADYGIDRENPDVSVTLADGSTHRLWFGNSTGVDDSYIYAWGGGDQIYLISSYTQPKFQYTIDDLRVKEEDADSEAGA